MLEPGDTSARTSNLQQTNTNGYKLQTTNASEIAEARSIVRSWGEDGHNYKPTLEYQLQLRELLNKFNYRLDTNYANMDRIVHHELEEFKRRVMAKTVNGMTVRSWERLFRSEDEAHIKKVLLDRLNIKEGDPDDLIQ